MTFGGCKSPLMKKSYDQSPTIYGILQISIHLGFSNFGVGTSFLLEPKPIPNFCSISIIVFSVVGLVEPILSMTHHLNST